MTAPRIRVWDPLVRVLHWMLVFSTVFGWATTVWLGGWHQTVGWIGVGAVAVRVAWGFAGPARARFADFVRGPSATLRYASAAAARRAPRHVGHNPLGAWMILALLASILGLGLTGWLYTTDRFFGDETVERIHVALAWTLVALATLHVAGVVEASIRHRENLIGAMLHGRKRPPD